MKELIRKFIEKFKKINLPDIDIIRLKFVSYIDNIKSSYKINKSKKANLKATNTIKKPNRFAKYFNKYTLFYFIVLISCIAVFIYFGMIVKRFILSSNIENDSIKRVLMINVNYATNKLIKKINKKKLKKRKLRQFIKDLNLFDEKVGYYRLNPCNPDILAFGEGPMPGNVSIEIPDFHTIVISAYNCEFKEYMSKTISLNEKEYSLQDEIDFIRSQEERKLKIAKMKKRLEELAKIRNSYKKNNQDNKKLEATDKQFFNPIKELTTKGNSENNEKNLHEDTHLKENPISSTPKLEENHATKTNSHGN